ncbi:hypothetical protein MKW98_005241 [Papaver atlanticum]|uniref:Uncharacterized protein n=1 Tax=Papaver atlanticum TaxID=357466 RepID=A0AAD4RWM1_9MAGN|nr:hypothetical protein MKW98_005241 [Papaver atlanticum]
MAMRVVLTKISPFASSETSSLGFIEGAQRIRRYILDTETYRREKIGKGVDLKEDMTIAELDELFSSASLEDLRKVNWNKYSKNKLTFAETRTETTKEIERITIRLVDCTYNQELDVNMSICYGSVTVAYRFTPEPQRFEEINNKNLLDSCFSAQNIPTVIYIV